jgi:hypothetical protein
MKQYEKKFFSVDVEDLPCDPLLMLYNKRIGYYFIFYHGRQQCCVSGMWSFFDPWIKIGDNFFPSPESRIQAIFLSALQQFFGLKTGFRIRIQNFRPNANPDPDPRF